MRLIDANALLRHKRKMSGADFGGEFWDEAVLASDIKNAPTVDAVTVVRCKDCIHSYGAYLCDGYCTYCSYLDCVVQTEFYCADGKRRINNGFCNTL